jgi:hypothetical protein
MAKINMEKKGQVTIFIIVGIIIVSAIIVFFLYVRPNYFNPEARKLNFEGCVKEVVEKSILKLEKNAGYIKPEFTYNYMGENITYLCYTNEYYTTCTIQEPFLVRHFIEQLEIDVRPQVDSCYDNSISELKKLGFEVSPGKVNYSITIDPNIVRINIQSPTTVGQTRFSRFNVQLNSPLYEMLMISTIILQYESQYGDIHSDDIMDFYPDYYLEKDKRGDGTTIYILHNKITKNKFQFASRSLAWPAGYFG